VESEMKTFALYVTDDRYSIATLVLFPAASEGRARAKAKELLLESAITEASRSLCRV
jgi:hypothetical protein